MVMELFPKKHYAETFNKTFNVTTKGIIHIGDTEEREVDSEFHENVEARITQYALADGSIKVNELVLIETDTADDLKGFEKILDYDILSERVGARLLPAVLVSCGKNYAYIYSGSRAARIHFYQYVSPTFRVSRLAFDARFITTDDLMEVVECVFLSPKRETLLLRAKDSELSPQA